jgi:hypothetical protein
MMGLEDMSAEKTYLHLASHHNPAKKATGLISSASSSVGLSYCSELVACGELDAQFEFGNSSGSLSLA